MPAIAFVKKGRGSQQRESARYVLRAADGRYVTNDMAHGPSLTSSYLMAYVWTSPDEADQQRVGYELVLEESLRVDRVDNA